MNDFSLKVNLSSVNISKQDFDELVKQSNGKKIGDFEFTILQAGTVPQIRASNELWEKIPSDSVWTEEVFAWQNPDKVLVEVRNKEKVLYSFSRPTAFAMED